jgi:hypothetical protein
MIEDDEATRPLRALETTQPLRALDLAPPPFDTARLVADGRASEWTAAHFGELPLLERIRLLATGELRFFRGGDEIPAREALRDL